MSPINQIIVGVHPRWQLVYGIRKDNQWLAKIQVRDAHAFSTGTGPSIEAAVKAAFDSVDLKLEVLR